MSMLKSRTVFPPGGWLFRQAETGWPIDQQAEFAGNTFDEVIQKIINHREANPRFKLDLDRENVEHELEFYTLLRLRGVKGAKTYLAIDEASPIPKVQARPGQLERVVDTVAGVVRTVKKVVAGVGVMLDWFGSGGRPVELQLATERALVCLECPLNQKAHWSEYIKDAAARRIKVQLEAKADMALQVPDEDKLMTCAPCLCWIPLKIWCPLPHIKAHMSKAVEAALDKSCWITKE